MRIRFGQKRHIPLQSLKVQHTDPLAIDQLSSRFEQVCQQLTSKQELIFVCIGTDRSTGDALGPLVGTKLKHLNRNLHIYGTLKEPVHAMNLQDILDHIALSHPSPYIVAIDACLGQLANVGCIQFASGPVKPGAGVHKELPAVGDAHVTGIVNVGGFMEYFVLQNTRLNLVIDMADKIATAIHQALIPSAQNEAATAFNKTD